MQMVEKYYMKTLICSEYGVFSAFSQKILMYKIFAIQVYIQLGPKQFGHMLFLRSRTSTGFPILMCLNGFHP